MGVGLFEYPKQTVFGRTLPKTKIYEHAHLTAAMRNKFVSQIERIVWQYKLAPETVNLRARKGAPEIEVFVVTLKTPEINTEILRCIDNAIPFPIIYEIIHHDRIKIAAAFKRPSEANSSKWVTDIYFESNWQKLESKRKPLPVVLDLESLYEQIIRSLMPVSQIAGEDIREQVQRATTIRSLEMQVVKLQSQMEKEKQFNRKVEINGILRELNRNIVALKETHANKI